MGTVPEARLNLVIFHMHNNEVQEAYELMKEIEPTSPQVHGSETAVTPRAPRGRALTASARGPRFAPYV